MFQDNRRTISKQFICLHFLLAAGMLSACAGEEEKIKVEPVKVEIVGDAEDGEKAGDGGSGMENDEDESGGVKGGAQTGSPENAESDGEKISADSGAQEERAAAEEWKKQFGSDCLTDQIFEFTLTENGEAVLFVPHYLPGEKGFYIQLVKDDVVLSTISGYIPEALQGKQFVSLDAVSFFDVNFDGITDIVLVETYGNTTFAAVYYGDGFFAEMCDLYFLSQDRISEQLTDALDEVTIPKIRAYLTGGKKNGEFSGYQEAYEAVVRLCELENPGPTEYSAGMQYDLIDFDGDDIPELAAGVNGYYMSLYTYSDGSVYALMSDWGYGAMGNAGYEYSPGNNSLRNYNADYAGLINYLTYMTIGQRHSLEQMVQIVIYNFDDANGNGMPDEAEEDSYGNYGVNKIDGREVTDEECDVYDAGNYEYIEGKMSADELLAELNH